jgi:hypothetical protein
LWRRRRRNLFVCFFEGDGIDEVLCRWSHFFLMWRETPGKWREKQTVWIWEGEVVRVGLFWNKLHLLISWRTFLRGEGESLKTLIGHFSIRTRVLRNPQDEKDN